MYVVIHHSYYCHGALLSVATDLTASNVSWGAQMLFILDFEKILILSAYKCQGLACVWKKICIFISDSGKWKSIKYYWIWGWNFSDSFLVAREMRKTLKITACLLKLGRICLFILLNLQFGLIIAFIVPCLAYIFRWQQFHHSYLSQFSTARKGALRHFCQPLNTAVPCRGRVNSPFLSLGVQWKESKSPLPVAFNTTRRVWLHLILANLGNLKLTIRRSLRVLP